MRDVIRKIVDVNKEKERPEHRTLGYTGRDWYGA
jgi:hypothetical protein